MRERSIHFAHTFAYLSVSSVLLFPVRPLSFEWSFANGLTKKEVEWICGKIGPKEERLSGISVRVYALFIVIIDMDKLFSSNATIIKFAERDKSVSLSL